MGKLYAAVARSGQPLIPRTVLSSDGFSPESFSTNESVAIKLLDENPTQRPEIDSLPSLLGGISRDFVCIVSRISLKFTQRGSIIYYYFGCHILSRACS